MQCFESITSKETCDILLQPERTRTESSQYSTAKFLGMELSGNMTWNGHVHQTVKKANNMLGLLRRNLRISNSDTKTTAYKVLSWNLYTATGKHKLEMVQRQAARYATNCYHNTTDMLQELDWESLESGESKSN